MQACTPVDTDTNILPVLQAEFHQTNWFGVMLPLFLLKVTFFQQKR